METRAHVRRDLAAGFVAFVPSCTGIMHVLDGHRFGVFTYATFDEVDDARVERYLPPTATNITIHKQAIGFRARFTITQAQLDAHLDEAWRRYDDGAAIRKRPARC